ncbi:AEL116Cp [Eremothecium gossypii ATCC 10895]|uniref:AEL116Cp n=1 Tax=Eremothecium gossypii (strain ATCC 10895 / CBS 109.51 / FGSC 9923 / NRRL Y-1056) TaxID=284811 RepID=Q758E2_EREGS|nr:mitochondrial 54S ribosomal protein MRP49 [Eremothecium gossypii ATCC 10895]AAS52569.1 AEL116Cp [Eremothecium gossypii ATCC 10895]AEY96870.1 FAEL116Cp [Eremothecium gossypii FDAG1]
MSNVKKQLAFLNRICGTAKPQVLVDTTKVSGLKLTFQAQSHNGHMGARKLWREHLPTLQFYNPGLDIQVHRVANSDKKQPVPCVLEVLGHDGNVLHRLDMAHKHSDTIIDELLSTVEHTPVPAEQQVRV